MKRACPQTLNRKAFISPLVLVAVAVGSGVAHAQSGSFVFVNGEVSVQRAAGVREPARPGVTVNPGDTIISGADGSAQLNMVDKARISLRPNSRLVVEAYATKPEDQQGAVLNLVRGTLRTFTGLVASLNRDRFVMKTRTATVGIRGSGNILYACDGASDCDEEVRDGTNPVTVNHTIEGSHVVANSGTSVTTGPGQTIRVTPNSVASINTPNLIRNLAVQFSAKQGTSRGDSDVARGFAPGDSSANPDVNNLTFVVGNNGIISNTNTTGGSTGPDVAVVGTDPLTIRDITLAGGIVNSGQGLSTETTLEANGALRAYRAYAGLQSGLVPTINSGTATNIQTVSINGTAVVMGRYDNASLSLLGAQSAGLAGSVHFIYAQSAYPAFFSDVLTGTASYTLAGNTNPTNQNGTVGTLTNARLEVNFTQRLMSASWVVAIPQQTGNAGGSWTLAATNVPITLNAFAASTNDRLVITNAQGITSSTNRALTGSFSGSLVGSGLAGAILGYSLSDATNPANFNRVSGVAAFQGPVQNPNVAYRVGLVSDGALGNTGRNIGVVARAADVVADGNTINGFNGLIDANGSSTVARGTATLADAGFDPTTGLTWGRWTGGSINVNGRTVALGNQSVHTIFSAQQQGVTTLPLTGTATYEVAGNTNPTDSNGNVGRLNSASLNANFSNRTVSAGLNFTVASQTINATANNMPIYRDLYFSAYAGLPNLGGLPGPTLLNITCTPTCPNPVGTLDGFFTGRTGQGAGVMYNINSITGSVAFRRPGA